MDDKFTLGYFADGKWAHEAFQFLIQDESIDVKFICVRSGSEDGVLKEFARKYGIDYLKHKNINSEDFLHQIKKFDCDLLVSMSFDQVFKKKIINMPKYGIINCHAGFFSSINKLFG